MTATLQSIEQLLDWGRSLLLESESAVLDSRLLLSHCLQCEPVYLLTWPERIVDEIPRKQYCDLISQRQLGQPIAYLLGYRDFWDLRLKVSNATLIPRPETELLVESALVLPLPSSANVLDLGTGTGAIALALASARPNWQITAVEHNSAALDLAIHNAQLNGLQSVAFIQSNWFSAIGEDRYELIVSNPPYVESDSTFLTVGDVRFEPKSALTAGKDGLDDMRIIIPQSRQYLRDKGWLMLEHGFQQGANVRAIFAQYGFANIETLIDLNGLERISCGQYRCDITVAYS
ncbi:MAG: release factor glutamine methyltransferase [Paraglaciecola sp.]|jgi:release factor glutamine methyltransferase